MRGLCRRAEPELAALKNECTSDAFGLMWSDSPCDISSSTGGCMMTVSGVCTIQWSYSPGAVDQAVDCQSGGGTWEFGPFFSPDYLEAAAWPSALGPSPYHFFNCDTCTRFPHPSRSIAIFAYPTSFTGSVNSAPSAFMRS